MCTRKYFLNFFFIMTIINKLDTLSAKKSSKNCDIKNTNSNNNQTFKDLWGYEHNWLDPEDGWDDEKRKLFTTMQKKGLYQVKHIPKYTTNGYKKMEIPPRLYELILEIRKTADFKSETCDGNYLINCHRIKENGKKVPKPKMLINFIHDKSEVRKEIESSLLPILENWSRQSLKKEPVIYGIRRYLRGAWLGLHVDHLPTHIISVILQIDQKVDKEWPLTIIDHKKKKKQINLKPGEMLLYESAKLWHGRQFPFEGDFFDNVFIHYTPNGDIERFEKLDEKMKSPAFLMEFQK